MSVIFVSIVLVFCNLWAAAILAVVALDSTTQEQRVIFSFPIGINIVAIIVGILTIWRHFNAS